MASTRLLTVNDVREALGNISRSYAYELLDSGRIHSVKLGRRRLVPAAALEAFIAELDEADGIAKAA